MNTLPKSRSVSASEEDKNIEANYYQGINTKNQINDGTGKSSAIDPADLLPMIEELRRQLDEKNDDLKQLTLQLKQKKDQQKEQNQQQNPQALEQLKPQMLKQLKDYQQQFNKRIENMFVQHRDIQIQQQRQYDEQLNQLRSLIESEQEKNSKEIEALRSLLQSDTQQDYDNEIQDHALALEEQQRLFQLEQIQKEDEYNQQLNELRLCATQLEKKIIQQQKDYGHKLQSAEQKRKELEEALNELTNKRCSNCGKLMRGTTCNCKRK